MAHHSLLAPKNLDSTLTLHLGDMLNSEIPDKKHKTQKNVALHRPPKQQTLVYKKSWNKKAGPWLVRPQLGTSAVGNSDFWLLCARLWMTSEVSRVLIWGYKCTPVSRWICKYEICEVDRKIDQSMDLRSLWISYKRNIRFYLCWSELKDIPNWKVIIYKEERYSKPWRHDFALSHYYHIEFNFPEVRWSLVWV